MELGCSLIASHHMASGVALRHSKTNQASRSDGLGGADSFDGFGGGHPQHWVDLILHRDCMRSNMGANSANCRYIMQLLRLVHTTMSLG